MNNDLPLSVIENAITWMIEVCGSYVQVFEEKGRKNIRTVSESDLRFNVLIWVFASQ